MSDTSSSSSDSSSFDPTAPAAPASEPVASAPEPIAPPRLAAEDGEDAPAPRPAGNEAPRRAVIPIAVT